MYLHPDPSSRILSSHIRKSQPQTGGKKIPLNFFLFFTSSATAALTTCPISELLIKTFLGIYVRTLERKKAEVIAELGRKTALRGMTKTSWVATKSN